MFKDLFTAFLRQFPQWRYRTLVIGLMLVMAAVPVGELLIFRQFAELLVEGVGERDHDPWRLVNMMLLFFLGFTAIRALNHLTKFWRVNLFRRSFAGFQDEAGVGAASWQWSQAFSVSNGIADLVQVSAVLALLLWLDLGVGAGIAVMFIIVMIQISMLYRRQIRVQREFIEDPARRVETGIRERIFSAEIAAIGASAATGLALGLVAWQTITGATEIATAIVLAMGAKMFFSRVSGLAPIFMRFARDSLRLERDLGQGARRGGAFDGDDDDLDDPGGAAPAHRPAAGAGARGEANLHGDVVSDRHRAGVTGQLMIVAQRGDRDHYDRLLRRLGPPSRWSDADRAAVRGAEAFFAYATADAEKGLAPIRMFWWPRPLPGAFDEWASPFIVQRGTRRPVAFVPLLGDSEAPSHLVVGGALVDHAGASSIVVASGVSRREVEVSPEADFISVRGPMTARIVSRNGGPVIESFGDARLLMRRVHRLEQGETNGRLAFVRNHSDARIPYILPDDMDELPIAGSRPQEIGGAIQEMAGYDGIVTSSLGVMTLCHSYGIPCALMAHERSPRAVHLDFQYRDYLLGAGLEGDWTLQGVTSALGRIDWRARLVTETVSSAKLDEIGDAVTLAILRHTEAQQDAIERQFSPLEDQLD